MTGTADAADRTLGGAGGARAKRAEPQVWMGIPAGIGDTSVRLPVAAVPAT
jgi:hypothetical protein